MRNLPDKFIAAMIAVLPLPGSPRYDGDDKKIVNHALSDLEHYVNAGVDSVILENDHDIPFIKPPLPAEALSVMEQVARAVRANFSGPVGVQLLEGANESALEIAAETDLDYVRVESFVYAHVGPAGIIEGCAGNLLRKRKMLGCENIKVFADIKKKHCSHALTGDLDITDEAKQAEFFLVDGLVVTGSRTGEEPDIQEVRRVKSESKVPVVIGSGMTKENVADYYHAADGFIVGSTFRRGGEFLGPLAPDRLRSFMETYRLLKEGNRG